jgi:hypothetical protein
MKEPDRAVHKGLLSFGRDFLHNVKSRMVLSKRSLIHSDSFQQKFNHT